MPSIHIESPSQQNSLRTLAVCILKLIPRHEVPSIHTTVAQRPSKRIALSFYEYPIITRQSLKLLSNLYSQIVVLYTSHSLIIYFDMITLTNVT